MRTIETNVYKFEELSEAAKEKARDWFRSGSSCDDFEFVLEDAATIADLMGIDLATQQVKLMNGGVRYKPVIYFSGFCSQGDGACFEGTYRYKKGAVKAIKSYCNDAELIKIACALQEVQRRNFYRLHARMTHRGRYCHEHSVDIEVEDLENPYRDLNGDDEVVAELMRDFMRWIYRALDRENDYRNSNECVDESIVCNEYEFTEEGEIA